MRNRPIRTTQNQRPLIAQDARQNLAGVDVARVSPLQGEQTTGGMR
jgi:hypothetical protein